MAWLLVGCGGPAELDAGMDAGPALDTGRDGGPDVRSEDAPETADAPLDDAALPDVPPDAPLPPPRLRAPMSTSRVTNERPTLRLFPSTADVDVELCRERACTTIVETLAVPAGGTSARPTTALTRGWWFWRARVRGRSETSPTWQFWMVGRSTPADTSAGTILDVNGDGYADFATGQYASLSLRGVVSVYFGGSTVPTDAGAVLVGEAGSLSGEWVASAGDVNGDGFGDLLVRGQDDTSLYLGSPAGPPAAPSQRWARGEVAFSPDLYAAVAGVGDVNGDGYGDVMVGSIPRMDAFAEARLYLGGPDGVMPTPHRAFSVRPDRAARLVASAGDVDGDGYADFVVTDFTAETLHLYRGGEDGPAALPHLEITGVRAFAVAAGDFDGDGLSDLAVGSPADTVMLSSEGAVRIFLGSELGAGRATVAVTLRGGVVSARFGTSVAAGDLDGDGTDDLAVGVPLLNPGGRTGAGAVLVYSGARGAAAGVITTPFLRAFGTDAMVYLGDRVGATGDVDGDGLVDLTALGLNGDVFVLYRGRSSIGAMVEDRRWAFSGDDVVGSVAR